MTYSIYTVTEPEQTTVTDYEIMTSTTPGQPISTTDTYTTIAPYRGTQLTVTMVTMFITVVTIVTITMVTAVAILTLAK